MSQLGVRCERCGRWTRTPVRLVTDIRPRHYRVQNLCGKCRGRAITELQAQLAEKVRAGKAQPAKKRGWREKVYERDGGWCRYCGRTLHLAEATLDHVRPRSRGGRTNHANLVIACVNCNSRKGDRTPDEAGMALRAVQRAAPTEALPAAEGAS